MAESQKHGPARAGLCFTHPASDLNLPELFYMKMNIQVFDINGRLLSDRSKYPFKTISDIAWSITENNPGAYIVNILVDEFVIKRKKSTPH